MGAAAPLQDRLLPTTVTGFHNMAAHVADSLCICADRIRAINIVSVKGFSCKMRTAINKAVACCMPRVHISGVQMWLELQTSSLDTNAML